MKCVKINELAKRLKITPEEVKASLARLNKEGKVVFTPGKMAKASEADIKAGMRITGSTGAINLNASKTKKLGAKKTAPVGPVTEEAILIGGEPATRLVQGAVPVNQKGLSDAELKEIRKNPPAPETGVQPAPAPLVPPKQKSSQENLAVETDVPQSEGISDVVGQAALDQNMSDVFDVDDVDAVGLEDKIVSNPNRSNLIESLAESTVKLKNFGFKDRDIKAYESFAIPSFELAKSFKPFNEAQSIAMKSMENSSLLRNLFKTGTDGKLRKSLSLSKKLTPGFESVVEESDKQKVVFTDEQMRSGIDIFDIANKKVDTVQLNEQQIEAYRDHKVMTDNLLNKTMDTMDLTSASSFADKPFAKEIKATVERKAGDRLFRVFGQTVTGIIQSDPADISPDVADLIGDTAAETINNLDKINAVVLAEEPAFNLTEADIPSDLTLEQRDDFAKTYARFISRKVTLQVLRKQFKSLPFYNPRTRGDGKFVLAVKKKDGKDFNFEKELGVGFSEPENLPYYKRFDSVKERDKAITELRAGKFFDETKFEFVPGEQPKVSEYQFQQISDNVLVNFLNKSLENVKEGGIITQEQLDEISDSMLGVLAADLNTRGFTRQLAPRREGSVIHGYETGNYKKRMMDHINANSGFISKQIAGIEYGKLLRNTPRDNTVFSPQQTQLWDAVHRFSKDMTRNQSDLDQAAGKVRSMAFYWYLTGQFRTPIVNLTQNFTLGISEAAKHTRFGEAKMAKASLDIVRLNANKLIKRRPPNSISKKHQKAMKEADLRGITGAQFVNEATAVANSQYSAGLAKIAQIISGPFSISEQANRQTAFLLGLRIADEKNLNEKDAFDFARQFTSDVHFVFGKENQIEAARDGTIGAAAIKTSLTFTSFTTGTIFALKRTMQQKEWGALARYLAMMGLFGGAAGIPGYELLMTMIEKVRGVPYRKQIKEQLRGVGGDMLAEFGTAGLPALAGADISGAIQLGQPREGKPSEVITELALGIWGKLLNDTYGAGVEASRGRWLRAVEKIVPSGVKGFIRAGRESREGVRTFSGKKMLDQFGNPIVPTTAEKAFRSAGFQPSRLSEVSKDRRQASNIGRAFNKKRNNLIADLKASLSEKEEARLLKKVDKFNESNAVRLGFVLPITSDSFRSNRPSETRADQAFAQIGQ